MLTAPGSAPKSNPRCDTGRVRARTRSVGRMRTGAMTGPSPARTTGWILAGATFAEAALLVYMEPRSR